MECHWFPQTGGPSPCCSTGLAEGVGRGRRSGCTKHQPGRPILRPLRGAKKIRHPHGAVAFTRSNFGSSCGVSAQSPCKSPAQPVRWRVCPLGNGSQRTAACTSRTHRVCGIAATAPRWQTGVTAIHVVIWSGWSCADNATRCWLCPGTWCPRCGRPPWCSRCRRPCHLITRRHRRHRSRQETVMTVLHRRRRHRSRQ